MASSPTSSDRLTHFCLTGMCSGRKWHCKTSNILISHLLDLPCIAWAVYRSERFFFVCVQFADISQLTGRDRTRRERDFCAVEAVFVFYD